MARKPAVQPAQEAAPAPTTEPNLAVTKSVASVIGNTNDACRINKDGSISFGICVTNRRLDENGNVQTITDESTGEVHELRSELWRNVRVTGASAELIAALSHSKLTHRQPTVKVAGTERGAMPYLQRGDDGLMHVISNKGRIEMFAEAASVEIIRPAEPRQSTGPALTTEEADALAALANL